MSATDPCHYQIPHTTTMPHKPITQTTTLVDSEQVAMEREVPGLDCLGGLRIPLSTQLMQVKAGLATYHLKDL